MLSMSKASSAGYPTIALPLPLRNHLVRSRIASFLAITVWNDVVFAAAQVGRLRQLQANPRVIPRNFHMHAIIQCVEHSLQQSQPVCSDLDAYVTYVTAPYFSGSLSDYLALAATAVPRPLKASNQYWQLNSGPDRITESVLLYPHLLRKGVSVCSCSS